MRPYLLATVAVIATLSACRCGPAEPTPVTLRVHNDLETGIFLDQTGDGLGMTLERNVAFAWHPFVERPACACLDCERPADVCDCACDGGAPAPRVVQLLPGTALERVWDGYIQSSGAVGCGAAAGSQTACLRKEIPSLTETLRVRLCYGLSVRGTVPADGGVPFDGTVVSPDCITEEFQVLDGVVEVRPQVGAGCEVHAECPPAADGGEQFCFSGACTSSCPAGFPIIGPGWDIDVSDPLDGNTGFFTASTVDGKRVSTGAGSLSNVQYDTSNRVRLFLSGPGSVTGELSVQLPAGHGAPLQAGTAVTVKVVDASETTLFGNRAVSIRASDGALLLAADRALMGPLLAAADTAPFTVSTTSQIVGCEQLPSCGKRLLRQTRFDHPEGFLTLDPGASAELVVANQTFGLLSVTNGFYRSTPCALKTLMPYAITRR